MAPGRRYILLLLVAIGWVAALALALKRMDRTTLPRERESGRAVVPGAVGSRRGGGDPSPYDDVEIPDQPLTDFVLRRAGELAEKRR